MPSCDGSGRFAAAVAEIPGLGHDHYASRPVRRPVGALHGRRGPGPAELPVVAMETPRSRLCRTRGGSWIPRHDPAVGAAAPRVIPGISAATGLDFTPVGVVTCHCRPRLHAGDAQPTARTEPACRAAAPRTPRPGVSTICVQRRRGCTHTGHEAVIDGLAPNAAPRRRKGCHRDRKSPSHERGRGADGPEPLNDRTTHQRRDLPHSAPTRPTRQGLAALRDRGVDEGPPVRSVSAAATAMVCRFSAGQSRAAWRTRPPVRPRALSAVAPDLDSAALVLNGALDLLPSPP